MLETNALHWKDEFIEKGRKQGREQGRHDRELEIAANLHDLGLSTEQIAQITGLSGEDVQRLAAEKMQI